MLLDVILWLVVAYLIVAVIWRLLRIGKKGSKKGKDARPTGFAQRVFGKSWIGILLAAVLIVVILAAKYELGPFGPKWTDDERSQIQHFQEAISLYEQAAAMTDAGQRSFNDWETVNALLEASLAEAGQVSDAILPKMHPELQAYFHSKFMVGLHAGAFGLRYYINRNKREAPDPQVRDDSLQAGRKMLKEWNDWFGTNRAEIMRKIE